ncbi:MAG: D-2-hydroxyacid dehydrogenase [Oculatellaceae cyanobacterium Prado106]|jgi:glyoxylate/hydroxypyruvate reductase A|nr:D-2-hydroxyacid dehydrogenase [Oculatellaceae cyanobacterium Prado106]
MPDLPVVVDEPDMYEYRALLAEQAPHIRLILCEDPAHPPAEIAEAEILLTWRPHPAVLQGMPRLKWVHSTGAGVEAILRSPHFSPTVTLTRTGNMAGRLMAEYVVGFLLAMNFQMPLLIQNQMQHHWQRFNIPTVEGLRCTVLGLGEIGGAIAQMCKGIGLEVVGVSRTGGDTTAEIPDYPLSQLDTLLPNTDVLIVVVPLTPATEGMLDARRLNLLPGNALVMNLSRGPVIVEQDLIEVLQTRSIGGAVLDVFDQEPLATDSPFWELPNVIVTPHIAGPYDAVFCTQSFLQNLERYRSGQKLNHVVNYEHGY